MIRSSTLLFNSPDGIGISNWDGSLSTQILAVEPSQVWTEHISRWLYLNGLSVNHDGRIHSLIKRLLWGVQSRK